MSLWTVRICCNQGNSLEKRAYAAFFDEDKLPDTTTEEWIESWVAEDGSYQFPITPEDAIWSEILYVEQLELCEMPEELLENLTTEELVEVALDYPFLLDFLSFDSYEVGMEHMIATSNIVRELYERADAGDYLVKAYTELFVDYEMLAKGTEELLWQKSGYKKEIALQALLASKDIFETLASTQVENIKDTLGRRYKEKVKQGSSAEMSTLFYEVYSEYSDYVPEQLISESISEEYFEEYELYASVDDNLLFVFEPSGIVSSVAELERDAVFRSAHSNWTFVSGSTMKYNCHSYCWINKSFNNVYWLENPTSYANASNYFSYVGKNV